MKGVQKAMRISPLSSALLLLLGAAAGCFASTINLGVIEVDPGSGDTAGFNIVDFTGLGSSVLPNMSFPAKTGVPFSDLTLYVDFAAGPSDEFPPGSNYFSAAGVGDQEFDLTKNPIEAAVLTGTFGVTALTLNNGSHVTIDPDFSLIMVNPPGNLQSNNFALITATVATPEPGLVTMLALGLGAIVLLRRRRLARAAIRAR
jgi:hypothetical protein